jgi:hypothetical protein
MADRTYTQAEVDAILKAAFPGDKETQKVFRINPTDPQFEAGVREGLRIAGMRAASARDSLVRTYWADPKLQADPVQKEVYGVSIDELDKIVYSCRVYGDSLRARQGFLDRHAEKSNAEEGL